MPSLIDLRRRIRSVKNTQQITKAMKMVSAAKLRRSQQQALTARPYASLINDMLASVLRHPTLAAEFEHPLLVQRPENRILLLLLSGEKGLCGAFNAQVFRDARAFLAQRSGETVELELIGRKGRDAFAKRHRPISGEWTGVLGTVELETARSIAAKVMDRFAAADVDAVYALYSEFRGAMSQRPVARRILPLQAPEEEGPSVIDYIYEQPPQRMFETLLPRYVETQVYQAMLESSASEHAARMTAMDAATRNAGEMIDNLTLRLNRVRQASITTEIIEIVSGAAALA